MKLIFLEETFAWVKDGKIKVAIDKTFAIQEARIEQNRGAEATYISASDICVWSSLRVEVHGNRDHVA